MSPGLLLTGLNSLRMPADLALIDLNLRQRRLIGTSQYFFILQNLIVNRSKLLGTVLVFYIFVMVAISYVHERMEHQLIRDGPTWTKLTASNRCLRYSTREYSALLRGIPNNEDSLKWCKEKGITVHGIYFKKPAYCTIKVDKLVRKPSFPDIRFD